MTVRLEWNPKKASGNLHKHHISFDEAGTVFNDDLALIFPDEDHSVDEVREIIIGHSIKNQILIVVFTERKPDTIRIISARLATRQEIKSYEENI